jgi:hypothetical protein
LLFPTENSSGLFFFTEHCFYGGGSILTEIHARLSTAASLCFETFKLILRHCAYISERHKICGLLDMYVMNTYGRWCIYFHVFLTWALGEDERSASCPDRFTLPDTHPPVSRVDSTASLNVTARSGEAKVLLHISGIKPRFLSYPTRSAPELRLMYTLGQFFFCTSIILD